MSTYPKPPWRTHGSGLAVPCLVQTRGLEVPEGFEVVQAAGQTLGMLLYLQYVEPSPRAHHELMWLPAVVRCVDRSLDTPSHLGPLYHAACVYTDDPASIEVGKKEWAQSKRPARFQRSRNCVAMQAADGTHLSLSFTPRGFTFSAPSRLATLQHDAGRFVCFQSKGRARVQLASYRLENFSAGGDGWGSFESSLRLPGLASHLRSFDNNVMPAVTLSRQIASIVPPVPHVA